MATRIAELLPAVDQGYAAGEAAVTVADQARRDVVILLDVLGLREAAYRWDPARVAAVTLTQFRHGRVFSANSLRGHVPPRAMVFAAEAFRLLSADRLIGRTGTTARSMAPGARGRRVPYWQLTLAGERASRELVPQPGMDAGTITYMGSMGEAGVIKRGSRS